MYKRPILKELCHRLEGERYFIQIHSGPRQTGKTTLARQATEEVGAPAHYATADEPALKDRTWIE